MIDNSLNNTQLKVIDSSKLIYKIFVASILIQVMFLIGDFVFNYFDVLDEKNIRRLWNIAREQSLPTWYSSIQAQLLGATVLLIGAVEASYISRLRFYGWMFIGFFFIWIGIDDYASIHERLGGVFERMAKKEGQELSGISAVLLQNPSFSWHTFIAPVFALCGLGITLFLWRAFRQKHLISYLVFGFGCWVVSQGIDFTEGLEGIDEVYKSIKVSLNIDRLYLVTHVFKLVEEELEMLGTTILWIGFLRYLSDVSQNMTFKIISSKKMVNE